MLREYRHLMDVAGVPTGTITEALRDVAAEPRFKICQGFIGTLDACGSAGSILGALAYWHYFARWPLRKQLSFAIWSTFSTLASAAHVKSAERS